MALLLTINAVDKSALLRAGSLKISDELNARNTCSLTLIDTTGAYRPTAGMPISITNGGVTIFSGTIDARKERAWEGSAALENAIQCVDNNQIADRHLVAREFTNETVGTIINTIVTLDLAGEGISVPGALPGSGPVITKIIFNYATAAACFDELATLVGYYWNIDYAKNMIWSPRTETVAPFFIMDTNEKFLANSLIVEETRSQYRNRQYIRAGVDLTASRVENFKGDDTRKAFTLNFPAGIAPTITVNAVGKTVGIRGLETGKDWYWQKGDPVITQDDGATALTTSQTLAVTYQGQFPIIDQAQDEIQITGRIAVEGGTGIYEAIEDDPNVNDDDLAHDKSTGILRRYGIIPQVITYETDQSGLFSGQLQSINLTRYGINANYLIESVLTRDVDGLNIRYDVKAVSGEALGGWEKFFASLVQAGRRYVVRDNEILLLLRTFSEGVKFTDSVGQVTAARESRAGTALVGYSEAG